MRPSKATVLALAAVVSSVSAQEEYPQCVSFGIDFQDGGSYFQNKSSNDPFTFVSTFEGCQNDVANNILVDPSGDQLQCSDTPLQPADTYQMSTCPLEKDELWSGAWSVIIISNNGDADPIAYQRDFSLEVGVPSTSMVRLSIRSVRPLLTEPVHTDIDRRRYNYTRGIVHEL